MVAFGEFLQNANYKQLRASKHWTDEANVVEPNASYMKLKNKFCKYLKYYFKFYHPNSLLFDIVSHCEIMLLLLFILSKYDYIILVLPAGILRDVFYQYDHPEYLNYGAAGFVIGHEILHGFDDNGSKYDKSGNFKNWWQQATVDKMKEKS